MENENLEIIKNEIQFIIDCIARKQFGVAETSLNKVQIDLNELNDLTVDAEKMREISKFQVLAEYLSTKIG